MFLLTSTSDLVKVVTGSATNVDVHASWVDNNAGVITPGRTNTAITTATTTTVVASPGASVQRNLKTITISNKDAALSNLITVQHTDGTTNVQLTAITLQAGQTLMYESEQGWFII